MSRRAHRTENTVSLFPFLAVLICAMGALILLLLVTTRRIRHQQAEAIATVIVEPIVEEPEPRPAAPQFVPQEDEPPIALPTAAEPEAPLVDPNEEWRERLAGLQALHTKLTAGVDVQRSYVEQLRATIEADAQSLDQMKSEADTVEEEKRQLVSEFDRLKRQQQDATEQADVYRREIDEARERIANADSKFTIMPYDGRTGTARRPIILECTEEGVTFASEGVTIRLVDLMGFPVRSNPLRTTASALTKYWQRVDARSANPAYSGEPYLLVVIRPRGVPTYYVVRKYLDAAGDSFGYELVSDDQEFIWPETDTEATRICHTMVEQMLKEREEMIALLPPEQREIARRAIEQGMSPLRPPSDDERYVTILGQRFRREPVTNGPQELPDLQSSLSNDVELFDSQVPGAPLPEQLPLARSDNRSSDPFPSIGESLSSPRDAHGSALSNRSDLPSGSDVDESWRALGRQELEISNKQPSWQKHSHAGEIGYEREVLIRVSSTQVTIADETSFPITQGISAEELRQLLSVHMSQHVNSWGEPPRSFYWLPSVKFVVSPGGNQFYERLKPIVGQWDLHSDVELTLE
ncbi:MAG: hypothetical protein KDA93_01255 [Planctomycetaceae bacterium]|nr:hypothetical protein [Planctomycetaceae bacterium]